MPTIANLTLNNGVTIPQLGLGVYEAAAGQEAYDAVQQALQLGYRHIDTASIYGNEADVGRAVRDAGLPRSELFVVSKVWNKDQGYDATLRACERSLQLLGLDQLDLYLIHWPQTATRKDTWRAMERLAREGMARSVGVSNYTVRHLQSLLATANLPPVVNQVEFHPFLYQQDLLRFCRAESVQLEAYSPLARGQRLDDRRLRRVADKHGASPAQVMIAWALALGLVVIPKSVRPARLAENLDSVALPLDEEDLALLGSLDEGLRTCWDPSHLP
ncbi:MAG: aldo/keto reductase [Candidatus Sericytochromatia bacterium]|nr:aldo/keto reductase [Candidatus Sericytochromatia bacterium]